jgi:sugar phosphate isomerase/epimerase
MKRRTFLRNVSAVGMGMAAVPNAFAHAEKKFKKIGIQLYTVRQSMDQDPSGTLAQLSEIGYSFVEGAGYQEGKFYGQSPIDFKMMLEDTGLRMVSGHTQSGQMNPQAKKTMAGENWEGAVADFKAVGQEYIALSWLDEKEREKLDDYKALAALLNKSGEVCKQYGIQLAYHNHDFEFETLDGGLPYNLLLRECDPALVKMELDIYWITKAGYDPVDYFNKAPGRYPLWHVKDMDDSERQFFTEVGNGTIDWKRVFQARKVSGMEYFFVEQDVSRSPFESAQESYTYLRTLKV